MFPLQITNRKWRKWKFVDGFHRLPDSSSLFHVHGSTLSDRYYCEFLWSWEKFLWRWSTVQPKMRYATVVVKVHAGKTTKWAHALMIGKESLKGWWILTTLKKWTGWAQALFRKVVGDRFYSSSVPKYIYFVESTLRTRGGGQAGQEVRRRRQEDHRAGYLAWVSDMAKNMAKPNKELKAIYCSTQANKDKLLTEFLPSLDDEVSLFCWIVCYL